jgi:glyoxylase I family protein
MADFIPTGGVHHFRLTVTDVNRTVEFYTSLLGFKKLLDLNPGAFLSNGFVGLGIGPFPDPTSAIKGDRFSENRVGLDHLSFTVPSRKVLEDAVALLDARGVPHSEVRDLGEAFGIAILIFRDPDNIQLELSAAR